MSNRSDSWELALWDAVETADRLRRREVSSAEVLEAAIARAQDSESLNAIVTPTFHRARKSAQNPTDGAFAGVPSAIKDLAQVEGVRTAWGSAATGVYHSSKSDPWVLAFERTGLVSIGKTATPEFGMTGTTEPLAFGPCRNPWDPTRTSGGSSGGAAALVAAGVVPIAHGSDGGGSLRIPASCCGLVGLKTTRKRFDMEASHLLPVNVAVHGVLSRTVRDTVAFWQALEASLPAKNLAPIGEVKPAPARRLRIGMFTNSPNGTPVDREVQQAVEQVGKQCEDLGHHVDPIACPFPGSVIDDFLQLWAFLSWAQLRAGKVLMNLTFDSAKTEPFTNGFAQQFASAPRAFFAAMLRLRSFEAIYNQKLSPYDVLLGPTLAEPPSKLGHLGTDVAFPTAIQRLVQFTPFTALVNVAGAPAISLPLARNSAGLPLGMHFSGAHGSERLLLELASELEAAHPWPLLAPRS